MDANTTVDSSLVLTQSLASHKWIDLGAHFAQGEPEYTFGASANWDKFSKGTGVTRPDLILANQPALDICTSFRLRRDLTQKNHLGLQITIKYDNCIEQYVTHMPPKVFSLDNLTQLEELDKEAIFKNEFQNLESSFHQSLASHHPDKAWELAALTAENYFRHALQKNIVGTDYLVSCNVTLLRQQQQQLQRPTSPTPRNLPSFMGFCAVCRNLPSKSDVTIPLA